MTTTTTDTPTTDTPTNSGRDEVVLAQAPIGFQWPTLDPFLFCVHHDDRYPAGDERMAPPASALRGRSIGQDFDPANAWRMYHGEVVPGFPQHPHRGFETVTVVRKGLLDHSDSMGAAARYGDGDVQWLTTGRGVNHAEMFPLLRRDADNPLELFQIWLNLPQADKMAEPHFKMLWAEDIPHVEKDGVEVTVVAGAFHGVTPPAPAPKSWAARPDSDVAIWTLAMKPGGRVELPPAKRGAHRVLYFYEGARVAVGAARTEVEVGHAIQVRADAPARVENTGDVDASLLVLQGRPINEPVAQHGPFVMNTRAELAQAFDDYHRTKFGGWPWPTHDHVHARDEGRFAKQADGTTERRGRAGDRRPA